jgi:hypothetical protein
MMRPTPEDPDFGVVDDRGGAIYPKRRSCSE